MQLLQALALMTVALLAPGLGVADPVQPGTATAASPATAMPSTTASPSATAAPMAQSAQAPTAAPPLPPGEKVAVQSTAQNANNGVNLDEIVCRNEPPPTGSRLGATRQCHTVREWNDRMKESQAIVSRSQMQACEGAACAKH